MAKCENINFVSRAKDKIIIQYQDVTEDAQGGRAITWKELSKSWAIVKAVSVYESINSKQLQSEVTHRITIRYREDLADTAETAKYRIKLDNRYHSIIGVKNLDINMDSYGKFYQELTTKDNGSEYIG